MIRLIIHSILTLALLSSCSQQSTMDTPSEEKAADKEIEGNFVHIVFFWLNEDVEVENFITRTESFLQKVDVIKKYHIGTPAMTPREVVDNSYSVCLVVNFDSKEDQDIYQKHEAHLKYVDDMQSSWHTVKVFDSFAY